MGKPTTEAYAPANLPDTPEALIPFLFDELWRISEAIRGHIVGCNVTQLGLLIPVTPVPAEAQLLIGGTILSDLPGGSFAPPGGSYLVPENGQYQISVSSIIAPFGAGNKLYNVILRIDVDAVELWRSVDSGDDDQELGASITLGARLLAGQVVTFWIESQHDQFTGDISVDTYMSINQTSSE